jgi:hypothetical protein
MTKKKSEHYVNNEDFYELLCIYKKLHNEIIKKENDYEELEEIKKYKNKFRKVKNELGKIFIKICNGLLTKPNFINYTWDRKDEMISDATYYMSKYIMNYNLKKKNPFAYFTTMCNHAFLQYINKMNKYTDKFQPLAYIENMHKLNNQIEEE